MFDKYKKFVRIQLIQRNPNLRWCVSPGCEGIIESNLLFYILENKNNDLKCPICSTKICFECGDKLHPNLSC